MSGMVYLVGGGPGDPGLITMRAVECLRQAEVVVHDRLVSTYLLCYAPQAEWIDVGKQPDHHPVPQDEINRLLVEKANDGCVVVRLKGGDPFVFGRGGEEAAALVEAGITFEIVPGVTSAIAGPAYAGIPVTQRNMACSAAFITGHRADCGANPDSDWQQAARGVDTLVFMMGVANLPRIVEQMLAAGRPPETPVSMVEKATTPSQKVVSGTLENIIERAVDIHPPALIIIGEVSTLREKLHWFERSERRPLFGLRVVNTRPLVHGWDGSRGDPGPDEFSRRLNALGAQVISLPAASIRPPESTTALDGAIHRLAGHAGEPFDWILFTSIYAVQFFGDRLFALGCDARSLSSVRLAAVGPRTAAALRPYGLKADFISGQANGKTFIQELNGTRQARVLVPHAGSPAAELLNDLQAQGARVEQVSAYCIQPAVEPAPGLAALVDGEVDVVTFFSPSALQGLGNMLSHSRPGSLADFLAPFTVVCVGPTTARAAQSQGVRVDCIALEQSVEGMCRAILHWTAAENPAGY